MLVQSERAVPEADPLNTTSMLLIPTLNSVVTDKRAIDERQKARLGTKAGST